MTQQGFATDGGSHGNAAGFFAPPAVTCGCPACALASGDSSRDNPHVRAVASAAAGDDARRYAVLSQYQNADGSWSFSGDRNVDAVLIGSKIVSTELTYTFPTSGADYGENYEAGRSDELLPFNDMQQAAARKGFAMVASYTNLTFREVTPEDSVAERTTFRLAQSKSNTVPSALGNFPNTADPEQGQNPSGDIWFGRTEQPYYTNPEKGNWGYVTILHEIGHTLGLKHGGDDYTQFNVGELFGPSITLYGTRALEWAKDGQLWSLMTYSTAPNTRNAYNGDEKNQATSYMMYDIAALQYLYGANYKTNAGDTVYRWDEKTGEGFVNGEGQGRPTGNKVLETIWDGGGNDTYDLSNYANGVSVDLRPGATNVLSREQLPNAEAFLGFNAPMQGSVGNALLHQGDTRSQIENAVGGAGDDVIVGNQADNLLVGNGGNDLFDAMQGSDTIQGGDGSDTVSFSTATTGITVVLNNGSSDIRVANGDDVDVLRSIENIAGTVHDDVLVGDDSANMLAGGAGGVDLLVGGKGDDRLFGGGFLLDQPDRPDVVKDGERINDSTATAVSLYGSFDLAARYGVENADTIPHATIVGKTAKEGFEYYSFTGTAGATVTLDVDLAGSSVYPGVLLLDAAGKVIAANYEALKRDEGSRLAADPKLTFVLPADGVYYAAITDSQVRASGFVSTDLPVGFKYILNVSLEGASVPEPTLVRTASATLDGGEGDDLLVTTMGDDGITGGAGRDTVSFEQSYKGITVDLGVSGAQNTGAGIDRISGVENVVGSRHADRIVGDNNDNVIDGGTGADMLIGGGGVDTLSFARQIKGVRYDLAMQGAAQSLWLGERVTAIGFENVTGSIYGDTLSGDAGANVVDGGGGDDLLSGGGAGGVGAVDTLIGGGGNDTVSFSAYDAGVTARLDRGDGQALVLGGVIATLRGIENLEGGRGADWLTGDTGINILTGGAGNDRLHGMDGDDVLIGGAGDDQLIGGGGTDTAVFEGAADVTIDLRIASAQDTGHGRDTIRDVENLRLGTGVNRVTGNAADNVFFDGGGDDTVEGGAGVDTVDYARATRRVTVDLGLAAAQATGAGTDVLTGIENLVGSDYGDRFFGNGQANRLTGGAGADIMIGGRGEDVLDGGDGNDVLMGDANSIADLSHAGQDDVIAGGNGNDLIIGGQGNDTLLGGIGNDYIISGSATVDLYANGYQLNNANTLDGGNDVIDGGDGIDEIVLLFGGRDDALAIDLSEAGRVNYLYSDGEAVGSVTNVEKVTILGGNDDDRFVGTAGYDQIDGDAGDDQLFGGAGDDYLRGGLGDDVIDGGEGFDAIDVGWKATGGATIDLRIAGPQDIGMMGIDTIRNIERIVTSRFTDTVIGGDENLDIIDDRGGADSIFGNGGNDNLRIVRYAGAAADGTIVLDGGEGNDRLRYTSGLMPDRYTDESFFRFSDTVMLSGGVGDDFITTWGGKSVIIDAGDGDDVVGIAITGGAEDNSYDITLGSGRDELAIQWGNRDIAAYDRPSNIVRDFRAGTNGDLLGLTAIIGQGLFSPAGEPASLGTFSPFLSGHVKLVKQGGDTLLQADMDGRFGSSPMVTVMRLQGTNAFDFVRGNVYAYYLGANAATEIVVYDPIITQYMAAGENRLEGHAGRDDLQGASGDDLLIGLGDDDILNGYGGDDILIGGTGADYMIGGDGDDTYQVDNDGDFIVETWDGGTDLVRTSITWTLDDNSENIEALGGAIQAIGNYRGNVLYGSTGGEETLAGGYGNDTYVVRHGGTTIVEEEYSGNDRVVVATRAYTLAQGVSIELMQAATGSDAVDLTGNEFDQMLVANAGLNLLDGGGGVDIVSYRNAATGVVVDGRTMRGTAGEATGDSYRNVEGFEGGDFADRLTAGAAGTWLHGRGGADWLVSGSGNDNLFGGAGADVFAFDTTGVSGADKIQDWSTGDRIATSKQLRGADSSGLITIGTSALVLLDGSIRGDTAMLVDQGGAVLRALGKTDGYWWYGFVSGANESFDGKVTELASTSVPAGVGIELAGGPAPAHESTSSSAFAASPFYLYDTMGDAMSSGVMLTA